MNLIFNILRDKNETVFESFIRLENNKNLIGTPLLKTNIEIVLANKSTYNSLKTIAFDNGYASILSEYSNGKNKILLSILTDNKSNIFQVSDFGKYENPVIEVSEHIIYIAYEYHYENKSEIIYKTFDIQTKSFSEEKIISKGLYSYTPILIKSEKSLFFIYNAFENNRYKTIFAKSSDDFNTHLEIGFPFGNDEYLSVCKYGNKVALYIENSMPLSKGDELIETIIPAFGHGWKIKFKNGLVLISEDSIEVFDNNIFHKIGVSEKSEGCAKLLEYNGNLYCVYTKFTGRWSLNIAIFKDNSWVDIYDTGLFLMDRIIPSAVIKSGAILVYGYESFNTEPIIKNFRLDNKDSNNTLTSFVCQNFKQNQEEKITRETVIINGEKYYGYWGDLHMHSNTSLCSRHTDFHCTEVEDKYKNAKDIGSLDFALLTDHDHMSDICWERNKMASNLANIENGFVAFNGFEWTSSMRADGKNYGHYNVLYKNNGQLYRISETENPKSLQKKFSSNDGLTIPHHPNDSTHPIDWSWFNEEYATCVEIFQVRGSSEYVGCPFDPQKLGRGVIEGISVRDGLNAGHRFSFTSGGEHEGVGITCVFAKELTRESIFEAVKAGRVYGTTYSRIHADFRINNLFMGEKGQVNEDINLSLTIKGASKISEVKIVKDGNDIAFFNPNEKEAFINFKDETQNSKHYYYAVVTQDNGEMAWISPIFIDN